MQLYQPGVDSSSSVFKRFFELCDSSAITELFRTVKLEDWSKMETPNFIEEVVGSLVVKQVYPEENGFILAIIQLHPGITQYNPALAPLLHPLRYLVALKHLILLHFQAISPFLSTKSSLQDLVKLTDALAKSSGLTSRLEEAKEEYGHIAQVLLSKAVKPGIQKMLEKRVLESVVDGVEMDPQELERRRIEVKKKYFAEKGIQLNKWAIPKGHAFHPNSFHLSRNNLYEKGSQCPGRKDFASNLLFGTVAPIPCPFGMKVNSPEGTH